MQISSSYSAHLAYFDHGVVRLYGTQAFIFLYLSSSDPLDPSIIIKD